jgi:hypothetical protein
MKKTIEFSIYAIISLAFVITLQFVAASPYQLNLTTGELIDLNVSNNETTNITIYILNTTQQNIVWNNYTNQSISWTNITNITNTTCLNCSNNYTNYTNISMYNYNYTINGSNGTFYNKTEVDEKFKSITDFNTFAGSLAFDFNNLVTKVNTINESSGIIKSEDNFVSNRFLFIMNIISMILAVISLIIIFRGQE